MISGSNSIKGAYSGSGSYTPYLYTDHTVIALSPNHPYRITFQYKILAAPDKGFAVLFYSPTGQLSAFHNDHRPSGTTGTAALTNMLGPYADYLVNWNIFGIGVIAIDNIQITDGVTGSLVVSENAETLAPNVGSGLRLNGAAVVTDPSLWSPGRHLSGSKFG